MYYEGISTVYLVTWVDENDACVLAFLSPKEALNYLIQDNDKVFDEGGNLLSSWDGTSNLEIYLAPQTDRRYQLQPVSIG